MVQYKLKNKTYLCINTDNVVRTIYTWGNPKLPGIVKKNLFKVFVQV